MSIRTGQVRELAKGLEPSTPCLQDRCATDCATPACPAEPGADSPGVYAEGLHGIRDGPIDARGTQQFAGHAAIAACRTNYCVHRAQPSPTTRQSRPSRNRANTDRADAFTFTIDCPSELVPIDPTATSCPTFVGFSR